MPIRQSLLARWAATDTGRAAAAPPISVMNSRRFIRHLAGRATQINNSTSRCGGRAAALRNIKPAYVRKSRTLTSFGAVAMARGASHAWAFMLHGRAAEALQAVS
jgi:hypothetical protein